MSGFTMCSECMDEYENPQNRRFHAQPNACPVCGPHVELLDKDGKPIPGDPVVTAISFLKEGKIVAVKGLGGFHLAVDGTNSNAVKLLRQRKHREEKPMALMVMIVATTIAITPTIFPVFTLAFFIFRASKDAVATNHRKCRTTWVIENTTSNTPDQSCTRDISFIGTSMGLIPRKGKYPGNLITPVMATRQNDIRAPISTR